MAALFEWKELTKIGETMKDSQPQSVFSLSEGLKKEPNSGCTAALYSQIEFRVVEAEEETLPSAAGSYRGPVDVTLSSDFPKFLDICKAQQGEEEES